MMSSRILGSLGVFVFAAVLSRSTGAAPAEVSVRVVTSSPGVIARIERPMLRSFRRLFETPAGPLHLQIEAPQAPTAEATSLLQVSIRHDLGRRASVVIRIPLPPGVTLAEQVDDVRQVQGVLYVRSTLDSDPLPRVMAIPLRFALSGIVTLPEAIARVEDDEFSPTRAPARPIVVGMRL